MSFNYILDMFGKFRKRKTRFSEIEENALSLLASFIDGAIESKEFAIAFDGIRKNFTHRWPYPHPGRHRSPAAWHRRPGAS